MKIARIIGIALYWLAWPAYRVYFRFGDRTRVVMVHEGTILAMQQWIGTGRWSLPGGGLHRHEAPIDGALREVYEETGVALAAPQLEYLGRHEYRQHGQHFYFHLYVCELHEAPVVRRQWYEVAVLAWLKPEVCTPRYASNDTLTSLRLVAGRTRLLQ
jgi:8-oxo-dGTP pyrophosphatase MutT (NUDIX family)